MSKPEFNIRFPKPIFPRPQTGGHIQNQVLKEKYDLKNIYRMLSNESIYGPAKGVIEAVQQEAPALGVYPNFSDIELREDLAHLFGQGLTADHFYTALSGVETIEFITRAFVEPGDEVVTTPPTFSEVYDKLVQNEGGAVVTAPLTKNYSFDLDAILAAVTPKTKIVLICNPNNPTGTYMPAEQFDYLMTRIPDDILVIADEVYGHFADADDFPNSLAYVIAGRPIIITHTFSKAYGLAGLRMGYGIAPPKIANYLGGLLRGFHQSRLNIAAGRAAIADQAHLQKNIQGALTGKQYLYQELDRLSIRYWPSQTNFLMIETPMPAKDVVQGLLPFGVLLRAMNGDGLTHRLRVTVTSEDGNKMFVTGLEELLGKA